VLRFAARRLLQAVVAIAAITFLLYVGLFQLGDPFESKYEKVLPPETQQMMREKFGTDKPFLMQYLIYLRNLFTGDFGVDFSQRRPVFDLISSVAPNTALLAVLVVAGNVVIGILAGVAAAVWKDTFWDALVTVSTILLMSIPLFVLAVMLRTNLTGFELFGIEIFPSMPRRFGEDVPWFKEVLLPVLALSAGDLAFIARIMRASMLDVMSADYLRTARAKGLSERRVILKHGVRNAVLPVINHAGVTLGVLMSGTIIVETVFQYNGLGYLFIRALGSNNNPVILAIVVLAVISFILITAIVDILYAYLDPRIRLD
jgi:oligopeptide transport system permease protein